MIVLKKINTMIKRARLMFLAVCLIFGICISKVIIIQSEISSSVVVEQSTRTIKLGETRGYIYDRNMKPLVNGNETDKIILLSNSYTKGLIGELLENEGTQNEIADGIYVSINDNSEVEENDYVKKFSTVTRNYDKYLLRHIIGYTDADGVGVCGIEKAFDKILDDGGGELTAQFCTNSRGEALSLQGITLNNRNYNSAAGVSLTVDKEIQSVCEKIIGESNIKTGAVIVMNCKTSEILASVSVPCYDIDNLEKSLDDPDKPFLNRVFNAFPVGSVIKPFIAAAAIESGFDIYEAYECNASVSVSATEFRCFNFNSHGSIELNGAIEKSCNCYFIDMGLNIGKDAIASMLSAFGFGKSTTFCSALISSSGNLPEAKNITSDAQLANLCFGQGELLVTPIQLAAAYSALANGGVYNAPVLMKNLIDDNGEVYGYYKSENSYRVVSEECCEKINAALYNNMLNGTGKNGLSTYVSSAGKTATAQTGRFNENEEEILCTWFAGFFPYEEPQYTIVIFNENGSAASQDCAPVFKEITEEILKLYPVQ